MYKNNANAFGMAINGRLLSPNEELKNPHATLRLVWPKEEEIESFFDIQVSVSVQLH